MPYSQFFNRIILSKLWNASCIWYCYCRCYCYCSQIWLNVWSKCWCEWNTWAWQSYALAIIRVLKRFSWWKCSCSCDFIHLKMFNWIRSKKCSQPLLDIRSNSRQISYQIRAMIPCSGSGSCNSKFVSIYCQNLSTSIKYSNQKCIKPIVGRFYLSVLLSLSLPFFFFFFFLICLPDSRWILRAIFSLSIHLFSTLFIFTIVYKMLYVIIWLAALLL